VRFTSARTVEDICWNIKLADYPRSSNRARIDDLFNGVAPYTPEEQLQNRISTNVNWLDSTRIAQDARSQFSNAILKPGNYFTVKLDSGPIHRRQEWAEIITTEINKRMKASLRYTETLNNVFAQVVLHGVGPVSWEDKQRWCPTMHSMADVGIPSRTLLTMENLPYFYIDRRWTAQELWRKTHGPRVDKAWKMDVVDKAIRWAGEQYGQSVVSTDFPWTPERWAADLKDGTGLAASDLVPTINVKDFYFLDDSKKEWGWKRRIVLDAPTATEREGGKLAASNKSIIDGRDQFIYDPGDRNYASKLSEILHFQFADGSVVAPFRYHSVRSLGFLLYSVCHLQNRLRCKLNDATFEGLLNYFRVANPDDAERLQKIDLINLGIIPEGWSFVTQNERWQVNQNLVQQTMLLNRQSMAENSTSYTNDFGQNPERRTPEKTATQVTAEVNATQAMVGSMLQRAYGYQEHQDREIARRFCIKNSKDADVRSFRAACLKRGVPEEYLNVERWNIAHERVIGNGNKQLELSQLGLLMQQINRYDPDAQRLILRSYTFSATDDPAFTNQLVPFEKSTVTSSTHDAELSASTLLLGLPMGLKQAINHGEYSATLLGLMSMAIQKAEARGVATPDELAGLQNIAGQAITGEPIEGNGIANHIAILSQEPSNAQEVKQLGDVLGKLMNRVKGLAQRAEEAQQMQAQEGNGLPPQDAVKLKGQLVLSETKAKLLEAAGQQKLQQKERAFDQKLQQAQARDELANAAAIRRSQVEEAGKDLEVAGKIQREATVPPAE
jgi:hypothetical protein